MQTSVTKFAWSTGCCREGKFGGQAYNCTAELRTIKAKLTSTLDTVSQPIAFKGRPHV